MEITKLVRSLSSVDAKLIRRDSFLVVMFAFALFIALAMRFGLPALNDVLADRGLLPGERFSQNLSDFYPLLVGFMALFQGALITGAVFGFALLDEKDQNTIKALLVTPVSLRGYVLYRVAMPTVLAAVVVALMVVVIDQALLPFWQVSLLSIGAAFTAPIGALFYGVYAENKIQGFAYAKFVSIAGWIILIGFFVDEPWQWLFGFFPPFWICKAYWMALDGVALWWLALVIGILSQVVVVAWLAKQFNRVAYR